MIQLNFLNSQSDYGEKEYEGFVKKHGFIVTIKGNHQYYVYNRDGSKESALRDETDISEINFSFSILFEKKSISSNIVCYEVEAFWRKLKANSIFFEGGLWNVEKNLIGLSGGILFPLYIKQESFILDISCGGFLIKNLRDKFHFVSGNKYPDVEDLWAMGSIGFYANARLRFLKYFTVGYKYSLPFNNIADHLKDGGDHDTEFRLRRGFLYIGVYF